MGKGQGKGGDYIVIDSSHVFFVLDMACGVMTILTAMKYWLLPGIEGNDTAFFNLFFIGLWLTIMGVITCLCALLPVEAINIYMRFMFTYLGVRSRFR